MNKNAFGNTGFEVSPVAYGGIVSKDDGQAASDRYVAWAIDQGVNYFDVAPSYGDAQEKLGNSLRPYRKNVYLACKTGKRLRVEAEREFEESFRLLHTDYFDVYQMHSLTTDQDIEDAFGPNGVLQMMDEAKQAGRVRKLGVTCHNEDVALKAISLYPFDTVLFPLNWGLNMKKDFGTRISRAAKQRGMGLLAMKGLIHRAWLSPEERQASRFPKSWCKPISDNEALGVAALKYTHGLGADILIPPGNFESFSFVVNHIDQVLNEPLSADEQALLQAELKAIDGHWFF